MNIPPAPRMIALALIVSVIYSKLGQQRIKANTVIQQKIVITAPHIKFWKWLSIACICLCKSVNIVSRAAKLLGI